MNGGHRNRLAKFFAAGQHGDIPTYNLEKLCIMRIHGMKVVIVAVYRPADPIKSDQ